MKTKKIVASILIVSMLTGIVAGCKKEEKETRKKKDKKEEKVEEVEEAASAYSMDKAADKVDAHVYEFDADDLSNGDLDIDDDDLEDGIYMSFDKDTIAEYFKENPDQVKMINNELDGYLDLFDIDYDIELLQEASIYVRKEDDENVCAVVYLDLGDDYVCGDLFDSLDDYSDDIDDLMELNIEQMNLDDSEYFEDYEFGLDNMSKNEYSFNGSDKGYLKLCITSDVIYDLFTEDIPVILDGMDVDYDIDDLEDEADDLLDEMPFDVAGFGLYFDGSNVVFTFILSNEDDFISDYETFMKAIDQESPTKVPMSEETRKMLVPVLFLTMYSSFDSTRNNIDIENVVSDIDNP